MSDPSTWFMDVLTLVRHTPGQIWPELGLLLPGKGPVVYLTSAFEPGLGARLKVCERETFMTFAELVASGWAVD